MRLKQFKNFEYINEGRVPKDERIKLLDDDNYLIVVPLTDRASQKYGAFSKWCTAVPGSGASIEGSDTNIEGSDTKLVYVLNKKQQDSMTIAKRYKELLEIFNGDLSSDDIETDDPRLLNAYKKKHGKRIYNFNKIAFFTSRNPRYKDTIWDAANNEMIEEGYTINKLGLKKYAIDIIKDFLKW